MKLPDLSERFRSWLVRASMATYALVVLASAVVTLLPEPTPTPLVDGGDWELQGAWMRVHPQEIAVRATTLASAQTVFYRSRTKPGNIKTPAFVPPRYISIPINGFSYVAGRENDVYLECLESGERLQVARANTNNQWAEAVFPIASDWCNSEMTLNAHAESRSRIITLGTPVAVSALAYLKTRGIGQIFIHLVVFLTLFSVSLAGALLFAKCGVRTAPFAAQFIALGLTGLVMFFVMDASAKLGASLAWFLVLAAPLIIGALYRQDRDFVRQHIARLRWPAAIWFLGSLGFLMLLYSVDNGGGSWSANFRFAPASWSSDNQLPLFVSEALADGEDMRSFKMGPWLVSDRPPLMTGLVCLVRPLIRWTQSHNDGDHLYYHGYHTTGILVNALWLPAVFFLLSAAGLKSERDRLGILLVLALSPFALFNSLFVWPKLVAGGFGLMAFAYLLTSRSETDASEPPSDAGGLGVGAASSGLSVLSHSSGVIALGVMVLWCFVAGFGVEVRRRLKVRHWAAAGLLALLILAPWLFWQKFVQPPGNALIKYAFAGTFGFDETEVGPFEAVLKAYDAITFDRWLEMRGEAVVRLFGAGELSRFKRYTPIAGAGALGESVVDRFRVRDFFFLAPAMSLFLVAALLVLFMARFQRGAGIETSPLLLGAHRMIGVSLFTYGLSILMLWDVHLVIGLGYVAHILLVLGALAGLLALRQRRLAVAFGGLSIAYSAVVWLLDPILEAIRVDTLAVLMCVLSLALPVLLVYGPRQASEEAQSG